MTSCFLRHFLFKIKLEFDISSVSLKQKLRDLDLALIYRASGEASHRFFQIKHAN